jgi:hypothetical protein
MRPARSPPHLLLPPELLTTFLILFSSTLFQELDQTLGAKVAQLVNKFHTFYGTHSFVVTLLGGLQQAAQYFILPQNQVDMENRNYTTGCPRHCVIL